LEGFNQEMEEIRTFNSYAAIPGSSPKSAAPATNGGNAAKSEGGDIEGQS
jgi:hypothetical protein